MDSIRSKFEIIEAQMQQKDAELENEKEKVITLSETVEELQSLQEEI